MIPTLKPNEVDAVGLFLQGYDELVIKVPSGDITIPLKEKMSPLIIALRDADKMKNSLIFGEPLSFSIRGDKRMGDYYKDVVDNEKPTFPKDFFKGLVKPRFHDFLGAWTQPKQEAKANAEFQDLVCDVYQRFDGYGGARYATRCIVMGASSMEGIFRTDVSPQDAAFAFPVLYAMRHCGFKSTKESMTVLKDLYDMLVADYDGSIELFERHAANIKEAASKRIESWHDNDELITAFLAILEYGDVDDFYNHPLWSETFRITDDKILYTVIMDKKVKQRFADCNPSRTPI